MTTVTANEGERLTPEQVQEIIRGCDGDSRASLNTSYSQTGGRIISSGQCATISDTEEARIREIAEELGAEPGDGVIDLYTEMIVPNLADEYDTEANIFALEEVNDLPATNGVCQGLGGTVGVGSEGFLNRNGLTDAESNAGLSYVCRK